MGDVGWMHRHHNRHIERIHSVLSSSELISDVRWHYKEDFDALNEGGQIRTINQDN